LHWPVLLPRSGVTVDLGAEAGLVPDEFADLLTGFLDACEANGKRGVWLNAPLEVTHLVPVAVEMGFTYHHANADGAVLTLWLPQDEPNGLPSYPHIGHGVGGIVLNARGEVLGIQEKAGVTAGRTSFWKIPGGLVDKGEDLHDAAVREVLEETGIQTKFVSIAAIRESQSGPFETTDCYCVCVMQLDAEVYGDIIPTPSPQEAEIANTAWLPVEEFLNSSAPRGLYGDMIRIGVEAAQEVGNGGAVSGMQVKRLSSGKDRNTGELIVESMYYAGKL
jgi:ADP-ribose pyrophosphatase YjhB (NUDIX family)